MRTTRYKKKQVSEVSRLKNSTPLAGKQTHHNNDTQNINTKGSIHNPIDIEANTAEGSTQNAGEIILIKEETRQASGGKAHPIDIERPMQDSRAESCMEGQQNDMKQKNYNKGVDTTGGGNTTGGQIGKGPQNPPIVLVHVPQG